MFKKAIKLDQNEPKAYLNNGMYHVLLLSKINVCYVELLGGHKIIRKSN